MPEGFWLNDRYLLWKDLKTVTGTSQQEESAIRFLQEWTSGVSEFHAHTSGSTGEPKKITFDRERAIFSAASTLKYFNLTAGDVALICMDVTRIAGKMMLVRAIVGQLELRITEPSRNPNWDHGTFTACAPLQLETAIRNNNLPPETYTCILIGGAPVSDFLKKKTEELALPVFETYGMTETLSHIAVKTVGEEPFRCIQDVELRTDVRDCLAIRGRITNQEWIQTNDRVHLVDHQQFHWLGRADNVINTGGVKVQPEKLERTLAPLMAEFGISSFFIHGFSHPEYGESPVLLVEQTDIENEELILDKIRQRVEKYHHPLRIIQVPEFKYGRTGKILRKETSLLVPPFTF